MSLVVGGSSSSSTIRRVGGEPLTPQVLEMLLADTETYHFYELLREATTPGSRIPGNSPKLVTLRAFASRCTVEEYTNSNNYFPLNPAELRKLRLLTLVQLAGSSTSISFSILQKAMAIEQIDRCEGREAQKVFLVMNRKIDEHEDLIFFLANKGN